MSDIHVGDLTEYIARINANVTLTTPAELAWTSEPVDEFSDDVPTILCYPDEQFSSQTQDSSVCRQKVSFLVTNLIIADLADLPGVIKELRATIVGWQPDSNSEEFKITHRNIPFAGMASPVKAGYAWWYEKYESSKLLRTT